MRTTWNDQSIAAAIFEASDIVGGRMPTCSELRQMGRNDLTCAISKHGGFLSWAKRLNLSRVESDSDFGWEGEKCVQSMFLARGLSVDRPPAVKWPFDLLVEHVLRVDVKTAKYKQFGQSRGWFYRIGKTPQADLVVLYQFDTNEVYAMPWHVCPRTNITISRDGGIYAKYRNNWDLIRSMISVRAVERNAIVGPIAKSA